MSTEARRSQDAGEALALAGNRAHLMGGERAAWRVESGYVDLFAITERDGEPAGARQHLARMVSGETFFSVDPIAVAEGPGNALRYGVMAVGSIGALARRVDGETFASGDADGVALAIERWTRKFYGGLFREAGSWPARVAIAGERASLDPGQRLDGHPQRPTWVICDSGELRLQGEAALVLRPGQAPLPLVGGTWVQAAERATLEALHTAEAIRRAGSAALLAALHHATLVLAYAQRTHGAEVERARLALGDAAAQGALASALATLGSIARTGAAGVAPPSAADPVLRLCAEIGARAGFAVHAPAGALPPEADARLTAIVRASRLERRRVLLSDGWWRRDGGPFFAYFESARRPVALLPLAPGRYEMLDPEHGERIPVTRAVAERVLPEAVVLHAALGGESMGALRLLAAGLRGSRRDGWLIVLLGMATGLIAVATPVVTGIVFDDVIPQASRGLLWQAIGALVAFAFGAAAFDLVRAIAQTRLEGRVDWTLQSGIMARLLGLRAPFFRQYASGDLAERALGIQAIREILSGATLATILSGVFSLFSFALLFWYHWKLALVASALTAVAVSVTALVNRRKLRAERDRVRDQGAVEGFVMQAMLGVAKLRVAAAERRAFAEWAARYGRQKARTVVSRRCDAELLAFFETFGVAASAVLFVALTLVIEAEARDAALRALAGATSPGEPPPGMTTGTFLAFYAAFGQFLAAVSSLGKSLASALSVVPLYERARPILEARMEGSASAADPGRLGGGIEVARAVFRYGGSDVAVLDGLSLRVEPGEFVAIVGPSGSGKSTLFRVLLGFEQLDAGEVFYDGRSLSTLDAAALRRQVGVVLQHGQQLSGSIYANIVGASGLSLDDAWHAARLVGLEQDILDMPMQMHTVLSDGANTLSGGQRQRLLLARALVHRPAILLLDEATSALDNRTQAIVTESLARLNVTRIIVAHRLSTVAKADRIVVLERGAVVQSGSYQTLIESPGPFSELARRQML
jgi:ATP-binding cassette subfamily C protein